MALAISQEVKVERLREVAAPLALLSGPSSAKQPHTFRCNHCQQTFERAFEKVYLRKQFCCYTPGCVNSVAVVGVKPISTEDKAREAYAKYGAELILPYLGSKVKQPFKCSCGTVSEMRPQDVWHKNKYGNPNQYPRCPDCAYKLSYLHGERHPSYDPDRDQKARVRQQMERKDGFYQQVKLFHNFTCVLTGIKATRKTPVASHHLDNAAHHLDRAEDVHNGVCILHSLHKEFHDTYGYGNNTAEQFSEFYFSKTGHLFSEVYDLSLRRWKSGGSNLQTN